MCCSSDRTQMHQPEFFVNRAVKLRAHWLDTTVYSLWRAREGTSAIAPMNSLCLQQVERLNQIIIIIILVFL